MYDYLILENKMKRYTVTAIRKFQFADQKHEWTFEASSGMSALDEIKEREKRNLEGSNWSVSEAIVPGEMKVWARYCWNARSAANFMNLHGLKPGEVQLIYNNAPNQCVLLYSSEFELEPKNDPIENR